MVKNVIMCIDDEVTILTSLKAQLKKNFGNKYIYEFAENANEAFDLIEELVDDGIKVLIIVSDWLMPGIKGDVFLIQVHEKFPQIVKVMLTGQADQKAIDNAQKYANLYKCLLKPWSEQELISVIKSGLDNI